MRSFYKNTDILDINKEDVPDYDICYTDPPWGSSALKMFETMMLKKTGLEKRNDITDILKKLGELTDTNKPLIVEYSIKETSNLIAVLEGMGHVLSGVYINYQLQKNRPYNVVVFNTNKKIASNLKGFEIIDNVIDIFKPNSAVDFFAGIGLTAKKFLKRGVTYYGYEINEYRYNSLKHVVDAYL